MEEQLISKKDLLELTGISYGQLYRWKRKNLIPEDWFVRKSTFTGQETFFPKSQILGRISKIQNMKEDLSLDDIADLLAPGQTDFAILPEELLKRNWVSEASVQRYLEFLPGKSSFSFFDIVFISILNQLLLSGDVHIQEGKMAVEFLDRHLELVKEGRYSLVLSRKMGVTSCFLIKNPEAMAADSETKIVVNVDLEKLGESIKNKIQ
ncbi:YhbD family protein [Peribacillus kribbensis]|uniref:YhbD family protein n=1 Tax=Peribacillus kribbensis TaxID=356658 RepID=UPI000428D282|nr:YhbD family protein [Peribacillus kribbensis]